MNKIKVVNEKIEANVDGIEIKFLEKETSYGINKLILNINKNSKLNIEYFSDIETKYEITINISDKVKLDLNEIRFGNYSKIKYIFNLGYKSKLNVCKLYDVEEMKEWVKINLDEYANINYNFKTVSTHSERYDIEVHHNGAYSSSNIINNGVNIQNGTLIFNVSSMVLNNIVDTNINQNNRIINLNDKLCQINPNLYIDENDVTANHSAYIGKFRDDEIFYLQRLGLSYIDATKLLLKGFLSNGMPKYMDKHINKLTKKYWR